MIGSLHLLGWTLVQFLWQGTLIAAAFALLRLWIRSPRTRYALGCLALAAMAAAPIATFFNGPDQSIEPAWPLASPGTWDSLLPAFAGAWLCGALLFSIRLIGGWRVTVRMQTVGVEPAPAEWQSKLDALVARLRISRPVRILLSAKVDVPTVVGWLRPAVLIPASALTGMAPELLEALLAHELAHVRRLDYLVNILQSTAEALLFFHPGVWWISNEIRTERELCCDDIAVTACGDAFTYARALAEIESHRIAVRTPALAANGSPLVLRIRRILSPAPPANSLPGPAAVLAMTLLWLTGIGAVTAQTKADLPLPPAPPPPSLPTSPAPQPVLIAQNRISPTRNLLLSPFGPQAPAPPPPPAGPPPTPPPPPPPGSVQPPASPGSVSGKVIDQVTRQPIRKATVTMGLDITQTGDNGAYKFENVSAQQPQAGLVRATAPGYVLGMYGGRPGSAAGALLEIAGKTLTGIDVELVRQSVISGRVVNRAGEPVTNVMIQLGQPQYPGGVRRLMSRTANIFTNDLGEYRVTGLAPGTYYVTAILLRNLNNRERGAGVTRPTPQDRSATPPRAYRPTYYPSILDEASAVPTTVAPGAEAQGVDIVLRQGPVVTVRGRVQNLTGKTDTPIRISLQRPGVFENTLSDNNAVPDAEGRFEIAAVVSGSYNLIAELRLDNQRALRTSVPIIVGDKPLEDLQLRLSGGIQIQGTLTNDSPDDKTYSGTRRLTLGWSGIIYAGNTPPTAMTRKDGAFTFENVTPGSYFLQSMLQPNEYIKSVHMAGIDALENGITLTDTAPGPLQVVISNKGGSLAGVVLDTKDKPVPQATVVLAPAEPSRQGKGQWYRTAQADAEGYFYMLGVRPADYQLFSWAEVPNQAWLNADFMRPLNAKGLRVTVKENSSASFNLKVIP